MKKFLPFFLIVTFFILVASGSSLSDMANHSNGCVAYAIGEGTCPSSYADLVVHHVSAVQELGTTLLSPLLISLMTLLIGLLLNAIKNHIDLRSIGFLHILKEGPNFFTRQKKIFSWLSLLKLSPTS